MVTINKICDILVKSRLTVSFATGFFELLIQCYAYDSPRGIEIIRAANAKINCPQYLLFPFTEAALLALV